LSGEDVVDGNLTNFDSVNDEREALAGSKVLASMISVGIRECVDLDLAIDQVDDPVGRDAAAAVDPRQFSVFDETQ
jgi:hypothetical protein